MADPYDFQIESMKFRLGITDQTPYVRTTAPFRKEQFDSSPTVGDQSLTGWWTRGQLSFHKGEGLPYYEVLQGETVLDRYDRSFQTDVFTPGEVTLDKLWRDVDTTTVASGTHLKRVVAAGLDRISIWLTTAGALYVGDVEDSLGGTQTVALNGGVTAKDVAVEADAWIYVADSAGDIQRLIVDGTYEDTIYTSTYTLVGCWYAKDRLWFMDAAGDLYAQAKEPTAIPTAITTADAVGVLPMGGGMPSLTDGGSAVFVATGTNQIYAITINADGSVVSLTGPAVAASLPQGDLITAIRAYLGVLVIVSTKGVRVASIDGSSLTIGPLIIEWHNTLCSSIGAVGSRVYVTGWGLNTNGSQQNVRGYEIDLSESIADNPLIFPYRWIWDAGSVSSSSYYGAAENGPNSLVFYGDGKLQTNEWDAGVVQPDRAATGYLYTGYHRFGTLDPKRFQKVTVRAKGTGTIQVYQVEADGTETSLGTMNAADGSGTFAFTTTSPVERMALKFVLNRDGTDATKGPTLLGYQIKALPVPERQRILRVPLLLHDKLTLRRKTRAGHTGKAYEDILALEALEKNQAVVTFTDHRTGETGTAYIDQVDFQGQTPSSENTNGFAGICYVTLRVLS